MKQRWKSHAVVQFQDEDHGCMENVVLNHENAFPKKLLKGKKQFNVLDNDP